jgi:photosystem II stability/assembly factor-like uncharacterized protein
MHALILFLLVLLFPYNAEGNGWNKQQSNVNTALRSIHAYNGAIVWCAGDSTLVLKTEDSGQTWQKVMINTGFSKQNPLNFCDIKVINPSTIIACGYVQGINAPDTSYIFTTIDGGINWNQSLLHIDGKINALQIVGDSLIYASTLYPESLTPRPFIYESTNNGNTWHIKRNMAAENPAGDKWMIDCHFID